jgi:hypothetical protein
MLFSTGLLSCVPYQTAGTLLRAPGAWCCSTYTSNGPAKNRHARREIFSYRIVLETRYLNIGQAGGTMIPSLETERKWARPVRLEDSVDTCL